MKMFAGGKEMLRAGNPENEKVAEDTTSWRELDSSTGSVLLVLFRTARLLSGRVPLHRFGGLWNRLLTSKFGILIF